MSITSIKTIRNNDIKKEDIHLPIDLLKNIENWKELPEKILIQFLNNDKVIGSVFISEFPIDIYHVNEYDSILYSDLCDFFEKVDNKYIPKCNKNYLIQYLYVDPLFRKKRVGTNMIKYIRTHYDFIASCDSFESEKIFINAGCKTYGHDAYKINSIYRSK